MKILTVYRGMLRKPFRWRMKDNLSEKDIANFVDAIRRRIPGTKGYYVSEE